MKVKNILVSQPKPETEKSPYFDIAQKYKVKIDFRPFTQVEGVDVRDFRKERIDIRQHTAVVLTSRSAADHFFRLCAEMRVEVPETMKYFCVSESIAYYLQKYVQYRKRKIFHGKQSFKDLSETIKKHYEENFLVPCSDPVKDEISEFMELNSIAYTKAVMYKTVHSDLNDLKEVNTDVLVFFSPAGIKSLFKNFPKFKQNNTHIAAFGLSTAKAVIEANLNLTIYSPTPQAPSMAMALEQFVKSPEKAIAAFELPEELRVKPVKAIKIAKVVKTAKAEKTAKISKIAKTTRPAPKKSPVKTAKKSAKKAAKKVVKAK